MKIKLLRPVVLCSISLLLGLFGCSGPSQTLVTPGVKGETPEVQETATRAIPSNQPSTGTISATESPLAASKCSSISAIPLMGKGESFLFVDPSESGSTIIAVDDYSGRTEDVLKIKGFVSRIVLSKDGTQIAFLDNEELAVYNLRNGARGNFPFNVERKVQWVTGWTEDERVIVQASWENKYDIGISIQDLLIDPKSGRTEIKKGQYDLPGYF